MKFRNVALRATLVALVTIGFIALFSAAWYASVYGKVGFGAILFSFFSSASGIEGGLVLSWCVGGLLPTVLCSVAACCFLFYRGKNGEGERKTYRKYKFYPLSQRTSTVVAVILCVALLWGALATVDFFDYFGSVLLDTTIYEDKYVRAHTDMVQFPEEKRNLIYIFLESMESSYLSHELGGGLSENLIPELYALASENINFSHNDTVGGWPNIINTNWTSASLLSQTAGVPLAVNSDGIDENGDYNYYIPNEVTLNDILHNAGYYQSIMFGSDGTFGGREQYFTQHSIDKVYDYYTAQEDGLIPEGYHVWWGFEDEYLFEYAKSELLKISDSGEPFAFMMLTADTHHINGYFCDRCEDIHEEQYANVVSCASRQVYEFVQWIKQQDFYDNTTVVICGDHLTMSNEYISENMSENYERHVYNCIINSAVTTPNTKYRYFSPMDMYPTVLASLGCTIDGDRLALGTNLFSDRQTLAEEYGVENLNEELAKNSDFYVQNFASNVKDKKGGKR